MKTETEIAKENVEKYKRFEEGGGDFEFEESMCKTHLQSCQRNVPFLKDIKHLLDCLTAKKYYQEYRDEAYEKVDDKLDDNENAIKTYKDAGIK